MFAETAKPLFIGSIPIAASNLLNNWETFTTQRRAYCSTKCSKPLPIIFGPFSAQSARTWCISHRRQTEVWLFVDRQSCCKCDRALNPLAQAHAAANCCQFGNGFTSPWIAAVFALLQTDALRSGARTWEPSEYVNARALPPAWRGPRRPLPCGRPGVAQIIKSESRNLAAL